MAITPDEMDDLVGGVKQINGRLGDAGLELVLRQAGADLTALSLLATVKAVLPMINHGSAPSDVADRLAKLRGEGA